MGRGNPAAGRWERRSSRRDLPFANPEIESAINRVGTGRHRSNGRNKARFVCEGRKFGGGLDGRTQRRPGFGHGLDLGQRGFGIAQLHQGPGQMILRPSSGRIASFQRPKIGGARGGIVFSRMARTPQAEPVGGIGGIGCQEGVIRIGRRNPVFGRKERIGIFLRRRHCAAGGHQQSGCSEANPAFRNSSFAHIPIPYPSWTRVGGPLERPNARSFDGPVSH